MTTWGDAMHPAKAPVPQFVKDELAGWQEMARSWPLRFCVEDPQARCEVCDQGVIPLIDATGLPYVYRNIDLVTMLVAHIRQVHGDKQPA